MIPCLRGGHLGGPMRRLPLLLALLLAGSAQGAEVVRQERLVLENENLRLVFDRTSGELRQVENLVTGQRLLPDGPGASRLPKVTLQGRGGARLLAFEFQVLEDSDERRELRLLWTHDGAVQTEVRAVLERGSEMAFLWPRVINSSRAAVTGFTYPNFPRLQILGAEPADDVLVHAFTRGMKIRNPRRSLDLSHNPIGVARYPQAYNGMTHQLVDYYSEGDDGTPAGGFFFATFDPHVTEKSVSVRVEGGELAMTWAYNAWDRHPGSGMELDFPFVIGANVTGDWYRAADHYREWALSTEFCSAGPNVERRGTERAAWLFEDIGAATFGLSTSVDQSPWLEAYAEVVGAPLFHVMGYDWQKPKGRGEPRGDTPHELEFRFDSENVRTLERLGHPWAVFLADLKTSFLPLEMAYEVGRTTVEVVPRMTPEACPKAELWRHLHAERAAQVMEYSGATSFYSDASAPNRELVCENTEHGHPRGRGRWMLEGFREMYANTRAELQATCGSYVPLGVELMHEGLLSSFDYYQVRNGGGFMGVLEGGFYRGLQLNGLAETVPVFNYIYHDYMPLALDGCGKLSERIGDVYYWMAARVLLQGSVFELNHEFSPPERFPGMSRVGQLHYRDQRHFEWIEEGHPVNDPYDPAKGAFFREVARARTELAGELLAYGRMLPPLDVESAPLALDFTYYNNLDWGGKSNTLQFANQSGKITVQTVLHAAWGFEERLGLFFVNLAEEPRRVEVPLDLERYAPYGFGRSGTVTARRRSTDGERERSLQVGERVVLELPPRRVVLLEL